MLRASSSLSARSATAPLSSVSSSVRARAPTVAAAATSKQRQDLCSSIAARVASSDNASTSSTSSFSSSSFATHTRSPAVNFAVLVAAVTGLVAVGADHLGARRAEATVAAAPRRVDEDVAVLFGPAGHLVSEGHRARLFAELAIGYVDVGEADTTGRDPDDDLVVALGNRNLNLVEVQGPIALV